MLGAGGFRKTHASRTVTYCNSRPLHQQRFPKLGPSVQGGLVLNLGHTDTEREVAASLAVESLQADAVLSHFLGECIERYRVRRAQ